MRLQAMQVMTPYRGVSSKTAGMATTAPRLSTGPQAQEPMDARGLSVPRNPSAEQKGYIDRLA